MKPTFKADKLGRMIPAESDGIGKLTSKRLSLRPKKSITRSKSLKPFALANQVAQKLTNK
ncbi:MAG: hypothetical protein CME70_10665 [Halobacteriovorax sp.]|nr:hypothetical protein [Halobacteriovorax sp.]|tara:strand:+ start:91049 stop:91228 length:180 start_codon:yes stop_codon:yes gene_type:complete